MAELWDYPHIKNKYGGVWRHTLFICGSYNASLRVFDISNNLFCFDVRGNTAINYQ